MIENLSDNSILTNPGGFRVIPEQPGFSFLNNHYDL